MAIVWRSTGIWAGMALMAWAAQAAAQDGDAAAGGVLVNAVCTECHKVPADLAAKMQGETDAERAEWLGALLTGHFVPDAQDQQNIAAYLLSLGQ